MSIRRGWSKINGVTIVEAEWYGQVDYLTAWEWQKSFAAARSADGKLPGRFLLLEHPPTFTLGRRGKMENLLASPEILSSEGIVVHQVDRGGDITYHGPGQIVGYPILNLKTVTGQRVVDAKQYVRNLEEVIIQALRGFGVDGVRYPGFTGVWVLDQGELLKIAAIGVRINTKGISSHGFALNVNPNMAHFNLIVPCGISDHGVISLSQVLGRPVEVNELVDPLISALTSVFGVEVQLPLQVPDSKKTQPSG